MKIYKMQNENMIKTKIKEKKIWKNKKNKKRKWTKIKIK